MCTCTSLHIRVYIHIRFSLRFSRFLGFRLATYAFDVSIAFGIKSNRLRRNMPFCCLSQHWFLYLQIFQPEEPTSYTSTICHPVTSSSRKAALGEGICVGTGKSAGEDLGKTQRPWSFTKNSWTVLWYCIYDMFVLMYTHTAGYDMNVSIFPTCPTKVHHPFNVELRHLNLHLQTMALSKQRTTG